MIEFIGTMATREASESIPAAGSVVQPDYVRALALAHEQSGFDWVLTAHNAAGVDGSIVADQVLSATSRIGVLLAHRPGFVAPTQAARKFATLDAFHPGRLAVHVITGGDPADQARDGDFLDKPARYRRTDEFLTVMRQEWESSGPFDFDGEFYRVRGAHSEVRPPRGRIPLFFGGASEDAVRVGSKHADTYLFWGEPLEGIQQRIEQITAAAAANHRTVACGVGVRPIVAGTEEAAWARGRQILSATQKDADRYRSTDPSGNEGRQRLLEWAGGGEVADTRLWMAIARVTQAAGNSTALVGSYEQVASALLEYVRIGVTRFFIRGYSPLADALDYKVLIDLVQERSRPTTAGSTPS